MTETPTPSLAFRAAEPTRGTDMSTPEITCTDAAADEEVQ